MPTFVTLISVAVALYLVLYTRYYTKTAVVK